MSEESIIDEVVQWLVDNDYPHDVVFDKPLPEPLRRPLAEAWCRKYAEDEYLTVEEYMGFLKDEGAW